MEVKTKWYLIKKKLCYYYFWYLTLNLHSSFLKNFIISSDKFRFTLSDKDIFTRVILNHHTLPVTRNIEL